MGLPHSSHASIYTHLQVLAGATFLPSRAHLITISCECLLFMPFCQLYSINALMFKIFAYINFNLLAACNAEDAVVVSVPLFTRRNTLLVGPPSLCTLYKHVLAFISSKCVHDRSYHFPKRATCVRLCSHILLIDLI